MESSKPRIHEFDQVIKHNLRDDCWLLIHGKVYNVTEFLDEHPGGEEVLLAAAEKDATDDFEDVGHGEDARNIMNKYYIGDIDPNTVPLVQKHNPPFQEVPKEPPQHNSFMIKLLQLLLLPLIVFAVAFAARTALKKD
ncbi:Cytochrome b5 [Linum grandiflorum]